MILGTVLVLSFTVSYETQIYFTSIQTANLQSTANAIQHQLINNYRIAGGVLEHAELPPSAGPLDFVYRDASQNLLGCSQIFRGTMNCDDPTINSLLTRTLQGQNVPVGYIDISTDRGPVSSLYICVPLKVNDKIIGAFFLTEPFTSTADFVQNINHAITIAGLIITLVAALCSFLLISRFMKPLDRLTRAAEKMKQGSYTQHVPLPPTLDELGRLGLTFNEMADRIASDVTELRQQDEMRKDLIANIAHDLATPLTAIQGYSEAMADDVITDPVARQETAQLIAREVQRLRRLVAEVRQMTSMEAGRVQLDMAPLDMHSLVDETIAVIEPECSQAGISVYNQISSDVPAVHADSDRVTQVLLNLLDNARRHTPSSGQIRVGSQIQSSHLAIWVSDTGSGITADDLPHVFERFYRADRSRTTSTGGSGLGLSIVKAIITAHGGKVWATSAPNQETRFTFTLPLAQPAPEYPPQNT